MQTPQYPWHTPFIVSGRPTVGALMSLCEENYRALARMIPDLPLLQGESRSRLDEGLDLNLEILEQSGAGKGSIRRFLKKLPTLKRASLPAPDQTPEDHPFSSLLRAYCRGLRDLGMLDLDDLEVETLRLLLGNPDIAGAYGRKFPRIFVDEYQDTNAVQVGLLKALVHAGSGRICAIGDPDQAIYGFRGADVTHFHRFSEDFTGAEEIVLTKNYRSPREILEGAASLLGKAEPLQSASAGKGRIAVAPCRTEAEEAEMIVEQVERWIGGTSYFSLDSGRVSSHEDEEDLTVRVKCLSK